MHWAETDGPVSVYLLGVFSEKWLKGMSKTDIISHKRQSCPYRYNKQELEDRTT